MKWLVPILVALVLFQSGFDKRGSFDLNATGGGGSGGGTGDVVIIG